MKTLSFKKRPFLSTMHLPLVFMLTTLCSGADITQTPSLSNSSDSLQDFVEIPAALPIDLIDHEKHHPKLTRDQRLGLVLKGYSLMASIINGDVDTFPHKLEFLSHYKDLDNHWKLPGVAYGDKSRREIVLEVATYVASAPVSFLYNKASLYSWLFCNNYEEVSPEENTSDYIDISPNVFFEDTSMEYKHKAQLESVVALIWALYDISYKTGNAFVRGSIILDDSEQKIHDYLEKYCCLAGNVEFPKQLSSALYNPWGSNLAYNRQGRSSHFVGRAITHYGIDARFQPRNFAQGVFPYSMTHLLFGRVMTSTGEGLTFIKAEDEGLGDLRAAAKHALSYALPVQSTRMRREKDVPKEIAEYFFNFFETLKGDPDFFNAVLVDNSMGEPSKVLLNKLCQKSLNSWAFEKSETVDIAWMYEFLWDIKDNYQKYSPEAAGSGEILIQVNGLLDILKKRYPEETLFMRTGNEVLFSDKQIYGILAIPFEQVNEGECEVTGPEEKNDQGQEKHLAQNQK